MAPKGRKTAASQPPHRRRRHGDIPDETSKRRKEDHCSQKEEIDALVSTGAWTKKEAAEFVKANRQVQQAEHTSAGTNLNDSTAPATLPSPPVLPEAAGDDVVGHTSLQDSSTAQAAAADRPQHGEPGTPVSEGMPVDSTPDLKRFFRSGAGGRELPPATQTTICPEATSADVKRLPTPAPAQFADPAEAPSSIEGDPMEEVLRDDVESQEAESAPGTQEWAASKDQSGSQAGTGLADDCAQAAPKEDDASSVRQRAPAGPTSVIVNFPAPLLQPWKSGLVCPGLVSDPAAATQEQRLPPHVDGSVTHHATPHGLRIPSCPAPGEDVCSNWWSPGKSELDRSQNAVAQAEAFVKQLFGAGREGAPTVEADRDGVDSSGDAKDRDI